MALIEVRDLEKTYTTDGIKTPAVRGLNFEIKKDDSKAFPGKPTLLIE